MSWSGLTACWSHLVYSLLLHLSLSLSLSLSSSWSPLSTLVCFVFVVLVFGGFVLSAIPITRRRLFLFKRCSLVFGDLWRWWSGFLELWLSGFLWDCFCSCWISWSGGRCGRGGRWDLGERKPEVGVFRVGGGGGGGVSGRRRKRRRRWRGRGAGGNSV